MTGRAVLHRHVLDLADLLRVPFGGRTAEHREVLCEDIDHAAVDRAPAGDDAVAGELVLVGVEVRVSVFDEHVELLERIGIEKQLDALAGGQLAARMLRFDAGFTAAKAGAAAAFVEIVKDLFHGQPAKYGAAAICGCKARRSSPCQPYEFASHFKLDGVEAAAFFGFGVDAPFFGLKRLVDRAKGRRLPPARGGLPPSQGQARANR